ncbi:Aste57867_21882 [Aphanomyces stellatus]|uniref:ubiquitinyl hydrolase 1 n=1 Tax=Aphanomyces stellatus TaxID=120398 RepID=A0A485LJD3_9STRA|nr:hypothetical protein As57867_021813 [Aphanomyces stellatus]VFT98550.1 Aste57867_21882 [Aphanomyces stellatus]
MAAVLRQLMWGPAAVYESEEEVRWKMEDFRFCVHESIPSWALQQQHGGPCGVFAPVQAMMLARLGANALVPLAPYDRDLLLAEVLADMLVAATESANDVVWLVDAAEVSASPSSPFRPIQVARSDLASEVLSFLVHGRRGVLSFVYSVMYTRGLERLRDDMDDAESSLTGGQFGHGTQELLNLMLTGRATSNVFDGTVPMGDTGLVLRGVDARPPVGYLTHLEALRYCTVGSFYKSPVAPVWVLGSTSHFTVLFATDAALCEESSSDALLAKVQRAFKQFDSMESGFMPIDSLGACLAQLEVDTAILNNQFQMGRLFSKIEVPGAGIVLWEDFWRVVSILLETNDLQQALDGKVKETSTTRKRSDSDVARELQAQFDAETSGTAMPATAIPAPAAERMTLDDEADRIRPVVLYHYNGLVKNEGLPRLVTFHAKIHSKNQVGYSVPMVDTSHSGGHGCPIEDVMKTMWPRMEVDWQGQAPPRLD